MCHLHQLQRSVLASIGLAYKTSLNSEAKELLRAHARIVQLIRQSGAVAKELWDKQLAAGVRPTRE